MSFSHTHAASLSEAAELLAAGAGARAIAGGTDLLGTIKDRVHGDPPELLVNLKTVPGLATIEVSEDGTLTIGALTRIASLETNAAVRDRYAALSEAARAVAAPQLRNMGTVGGNLCQEPRCWYYRAPENTFFCARKGGRYCNALTGENRFHSIFGSAQVAARPCSAACPGEVEIPEYLALLRAGDLDGACRVLLARNPMPAVTGRLCPHSCEGDCSRLLFDEAVSVRDVERFLGDHILDHAERFLAPPANETARTMAVVGSGPAGLSAAYYLRRRGHKVTVYERQPQQGGMLRYGIPAYRLPKIVLDRLLAAYADMGIEFRTGVESGGDLDLDALRREADGLFVATGAWSVPRIGLEGEEKLLSGLSFLESQAKGEARVPGPRLVVVGGGNVAVDVAVTARRMGVEKVTIVCLERREEMPALPWELEEALTEGVELMPSFGPAEILEEGGRVTGLVLRRCVSVFDDSGSFCPAFADDERLALEADDIILAVGQRAEVDRLAQAGMAVTGGSVQVDPDSQATSLPDVYAGGDLTSGPATVIAALAAGRRGASSLHVGVSLNDPTAAADARDEYPEFRPPHLQTFAPEALRRSLRAEVRAAPVAARVVAREDAATISAEAAAREAHRCFNCGCVAACPSDLAPVLLACDAVIGTTMRDITAGEFFAAPASGSTVLRSGELVQNVRLPAWSGEWRSRYEKFRVRNTIDFPIVGAACALRVQAGVITEARVVLGAVAPMPVRAKEAEVWLVGRSLTEVDEAEAARRAVAGALPLADNGYKVRIARALVEKAIRYLCAEERSAEKVSAPTAPEE
jgi:NADPH-dependent glutamate synthase beta subunit-like oxidoreductase